MLDGRTLRYASATCMRYLSWPVAALIGLLLSPCVRATEGTGEAFAFLADAVHVTEAAISKCAAANPNSESQFYTTYENWRSRNGAAAARYRQDFLAEAGRHSENERLEMVAFTERANAAWVAERTADTSACTSLLADLAHSDL